MTSPPLPLQMTLTYRRRDGAELHATLTDGVPFASVHRVDGTHESIALPALGLSKILWFFDFVRIVGDDDRTPLKTAALVDHTPSFSK
jgi:hypothetical protein